MLTQRERLDALAVERDDDLGDAWRVGLVDLADVAAAVSPPSATETPSWVCSAASSGETLTPS